MANIQPDSCGKLFVPDGAAISSLTYTKFVAPDGNRGRVGWIGVSYAELAPVYVSALLTLLKVSAKDTTADARAVTIEFDASTERVDNLLRMIRQCESKSQKFRLVFLEPPSQLFGGRFRGELFRDCTLARVSGEHKWVVMSGEIDAMGQK